MVNEVSTQQSSLYTDCGFNILKQFHKEIGEYLERKFERVGFKWNILIESSTIKVEIVYHIDPNAIIKCSKNLTTHVTQLNKPNRFDIY